MESLPVSVVVHIFSFLPVKDKCRAARVCRSWYHLVREKQLWKEVDLTPYRINLQTTWKLARCYFTDALRSLRLQGFLHSVKKTECVSDAALSGLAERCPRLAELRIQEAALASIDSARLPGTLEVLEIRRCTTSPGWLGPAVRAGRLDSLRVLTLSGSTRICDQDLKDLATLPQGGALRSLHLAGCYRLTQEGFSALAEHLPDLGHLDVASTNFGDEGMHFVGRHLKRLKTLDVQGCNALTELCLGPLSSLSALRSLNLRGLRIGRDQLADLLNKLKKLQSLDVSASDVLTEADFEGRIAGTSYIGRIFPEEQS